MHAHESVSGLKLRAAARESEDAIEFLWAARVEEAVEKHRQLQRVIIQVKDETSILEKKNPTLIGEAFSLQRSMQKNVLGASFWKKATEKHVHLTS